MLGCAAVSALAGVGNAALSEEGVIELYRLLVSEQWLGADGWEFVDDAKGGDSVGVSIGWAEPKS